MYKEQNLNLKNYKIICSLCELSRKIYTQREKVIKATQAFSLGKPLRSRDKTLLMRQSASPPMRLSGHTPISPSA